MKDTINGLSEIFEIKVETSINDFLGCVITRDSKCMMMGQTRIVDKLKSIDSIDVPKDKWMTTSVPGFFVVRPRNIYEMIEEKGKKVSDI
jgi:hypothetical protein